MGVSNEDVAVLGMNGCKDEGVEDVDMDEEAGDLNPIYYTKEYEYLTWEFVRGLMAGLKGIVLCKGGFGVERDVGMSGCKDEGVEDVS